MQEAERKAQVDKALIKCNHCNCLIYKGKSVKNFKALCNKYPKDKLIMGTVYRDHIDPVIPVGKRSKDLTLDIIADRIFCEEGNIQMLCLDCHSKKTKEENKKR